ncbi:hypothetical protein TRVL_07178 [Trypanosoma vivax]|nr:hypothetical protein TRVL_07178 [Trypanosoma vivax]
MSCHLALFPIRCPERVDPTACNRTAEAAVGDATRAFRPIGRSPSLIRGFSSRGDHVRICDSAAVSVTRCGTAARATRGVGRKCLWYHKTGTPSALLQGCVKRSVSYADGVMGLIIKG